MIDSMQLTFGDGGVLDLVRPRIMGILNATPDSFSDGGAYRSPGQAAQAAMQMIDEGADLIDVGGESTRPGAQRIDPDEQIRRVIPVIEAIMRLKPQAPGLKPLLSIDTTRADVAEAALDAGAKIINDVSAGRDDPAMFDLAAKRNVPMILMHMRGEPTTMQDNSQYDDVVDEVRSFLLKRAEALQNAGLPADRIVIDPGIGFGKTTAHNLALLANLDAFVQTGYPVLLGTSRKRFIGEVCDQPDPIKRVAGTCATTALGVTAGVRLFRVHDVAANRQAADIAMGVVESRDGSK